VLLVEKNYIFKVLSARARMSVFMHIFAIALMSFSKRLFTNSFQNYR